MSKKPRGRAPSVGEWPLDDEITGLRVAGTQQSYQLSPSRRVQLIGSAASCDVVIRDRGRTVAAQHAKLVRQASRWSVRALGDPEATPLARDRVPLPEFPLVPGIEIGIGGVTLITESERSRALRRVLVRLIGFDAQHAAEVDRALRTALTAGSGRGALTLYGNGDLAAVAQLLHRHTLHGRPFVRWERRTREDPGDALAAAAGGTLCVSANDLLWCVDELVERRRRSTTRVQLVILVTAVRRLRPIVAAVAEPIVLTPLSRRKDECLRIIDELTVEAAQALGIEPTPLSDADRRTILRFDASTVPAIERATLRIVALRHWRYFARAAHELGMAHASLMEWAAPRRLGGGHQRGRPPRDDAPS
jgi:Inner membrane component of T3SS, cytoplasmic domain